MANNLIYPFGQNASGNNTLTDTNYQSDNQRLIGNQPGIARQELVNKALKSDSVIAATLAQYIADHQASDVSDGLSIATLVQMLDTALNNGVGIKTQVVHSASQTLSTSDANSVITLNSSATADSTFTLPDAGAAASGLLNLYIKNASSYTLTVAVPTGNQFDGNVNNVLQPGQAAYYWNDSGSVWLQLSSTGGSTSPIVVGNATANNEAVALGQMNSPITAHALIGGNNTTLSASVSFTAPSPGILFAVGSRNVSATGGGSHAGTLYINNTQIETDNTAVSMSHSGGVTTNGGSVSAHYTASSGITFSVTCSLTFIPTV